MVDQQFIFIVQTNFLLFSYITVGFCYEEKVFLFTIQLHAAS